MNAGGLFGLGGCGGKISNAWSLEGEADPDFLASRRLALDTLAQRAEVEVHVEELLNEQLLLRSLIICNCKSMSKQYDKRLHDIATLKKENAALREENCALCARGSDSRATTPNRVNVVNLRPVAGHKDEPRLQTHCSSPHPEGDRRGVPLPGAPHSEALVACSSNDGIPCPSRVGTTASVGGRSAIGNGQLTMPHVVDVNSEFVLERWDVRTSPRYEPPHGESPAHLHIDEEEVRPTTAGSIAASGDTPLTNNDTQPSKHPKQKRQSEWFTQEQDDDREQERLRKKLERTALFPDSGARISRRRATAFGRAAINDDSFHSTGIFVATARHAWFEYMTLLVLAINSLWLAIDTDLNKSAFLYEADPLFIIADNVFCLFFVAELAIRFMAARHRLTCFFDHRFVFDAVLVLITVVETWILPVVLPLLGGTEAGPVSTNSHTLRLLRLFRLTRMARMVRLVRAVPELCVLTKAIGIAFRSVAVTFAFLFIIIYVFSLALTQSLENSDLGVDKFGNVLASMHTLFVEGIFPDHAQLVEEAGDEHWIYWVAVAVYLLLAFITLLNMLVGILCEVVGCVATEERDDALTRFVSSELIKLLKIAVQDPDRTEVITKREFDKLLDLPGAVRVFNALGVDMSNVKGLKDIFFADESEVTYTALMDLVLQLRSKNVATVKDVYEFRQYIHLEFKRLRQSVGMGQVLR